MSRGPWIDPSWWRIPVPIMEVSKTENHLGDTAPVNKVLPVYRAAFWDEMRESLREACHREIKTTNDVNNR